MKKKLSQKIGCQWIKPPQIHGLVCVGRALKWKKCTIDVFVGIACSLIPPQFLVSLSQASHDGCLAAFFT